MTLTEFGEALGRAIDEPPYSGKSVARFLQGTTTREMTEAVVALTGIALPPSTTTTVEELKLWQEYGEQLWLSDRRHFLLLLGDIGELVRDYQRVNARLKPKKD